jgi:hypothetical protein
MTNTTSNFPFHIRSWRCRMLWQFDPIMDNFRRGQHSFLVTGPKIYQLYWTSFNVWAQQDRHLKWFWHLAPKYECSPLLKLSMTQSLPYSSKNFNWDNLWLSLAQYQWEACQTNIRCPVLKENLFYVSLLATLICFSLVFMHSCAFLVISYLWKKWHT